MTEILIIKQIPLFLRHPADDHFSEISNSFPPFSLQLLPEHVQTELNSYDGDPPVVTADETWRTIRAAKKPHSGVPGELPMEIIIENSVELATPLSPELQKSYFCPVF